MLKGFKDFILKGNVVDLAVAVVIGAAFGALVASLVENIFTPLIAAIIGEPSFGGLTFTVNSSVFSYGLVINAIITFLSVAAVIYFVVVQPMNKIMEKRKPGLDVEDETRACPECMSDIPKAAPGAPSAPRRSRPAA